MVSYRYYGREVVLWGHFLLVPSPLGPRLVPALGTETLSMPCALQHLIQLSIFLQSLFCFLFFLYLFQTFSFFLLLFLSLFLSHQVAWGWLGRWDWGFHLFVAMCRAMCRAVSRLCGSRQVRRAPSLTLPSCLNLELCWIFWALNPFFWTTWEDFRCRNCRPSPNCRGLRLFPILAPSASFHDFREPGDQLDQVPIISCHDFNSLMIDSDRSYRSWTSDERSTV